MVRQSLNLQPTSRAINFQHLIWICVVLFFRAGLSTWEVADVKVATVIVELTEELLILKNIIASRALV